MAVLTSEQQQYLQDTGQTPPANIGDGIIQPAAVPSTMVPTTVPPTATSPVLSQPMSLISRTPQGPTPQSSVQNTLNSLPSAPTSGKGGMGIPAQPSQLSTQVPDPRYPEFGLPVIPPPSTVFPPPALPTPVPLPPQGPTTSLVQRRPTDAVNASDSSMRLGKGGGMPSQPSTGGVSSLFSPDYTPTVYDTSTGSDYSDEYLRATESSRQSLSDLSRAIQPGSLVQSEEEDDGPTPEEIRRPQAGEPIIESDFDNDEGDD